MAGRRGGVVPDRVRLRHMLDAAQDAVRYCRDRQREDLDADSMLLRAVVQAVQSIGEAAARTTDEGRARAPDLPWTQIVGMRHILVHVYYDIDAEAVWRVVQDDLPALVREISEALAAWPEPPAGGEGVQPTT
ncbi:MAG: DUF86 domain-containing protein [Phycisphaerales bacterium]